MKVGDIVMFVDEGRYARWFFGQLAEVLHYTEVGSDGRAHCRVRWAQPVKYHDGTTTQSDFSADKFQVYQPEVPHA
jgi:hypothetical protein